MIPCTCIHPHTKDDESGRNIAQSESYLFSHTTRNFPQHSLNTFLLLVTVPLIRSKRVSHSWGKFVLKVKSEMNYAKQADFKGVYGLSSDLTLQNRNRLSYDV